MNEVTGIVKKILDEETYGDFVKRTFILETDEKYPQELPIDMTGDKIALVDTLNVGDEVTVGINIRGNENKGRWYCSLRGWKTSVIRPAVASEEEYSYSSGGGKVEKVTLSQLVDLSKGHVLDGGVWVDIGKFKKDMNIGSVPPKSEAPPPPPSDDSGAEDDDENLPF